MDHLQAGIQLAFAVLPWRRHFSSQTLGRSTIQRLDSTTNAYRGLDPSHHAVGKRLIGMAAVNQNAFHPLQIRFAPVDGCQRAVAVHSVGCNHDDSVGQPGESTAIYRLMPLIFLPASWRFCSALRQGTFDLRRSLKMTAGARVVERTTAEPELCRCLFCSRPRSVQNGTEVLIPRPSLPARLPCA